MLLITSLGFYSVSPYCSGLNTEATRSLNCNAFFYSNIIENLTIPHSKSKYILGLTATFHWLLLRIECDRCLGCNCQSAFTWQLKTQYITLISFAPNTSTIKEAEQGMRNWHHFQKLSLVMLKHWNVYFAHIFISLFQRHW